MVHEMQFPNDAAKTSAPENNNFKEIMTGFKLDYKKEISEMQDKPLTRTEGLILTSISNALHSADPAALQEALSTLDEHQGSVNRVLGKLAKIFQQADEDGSLKIKWEQGKDSTGASFVRLHLSKPGAQGQDVNVTVGSDGRNQAIYRNPKPGIPDQVMPLDEGLRGVRPQESRRQAMVKKDLMRKATENAV